jgi:pyruvate,water dikinase
MKTSRMSGGAPLAVPLKGLRQGQYGLIGGKAANLAAMLSAELPVPLGFCVTVTAFQAFLDSCPRRGEFMRFCHALRRAA